MRDNDQSSKGIVDLTEKLRGNIASVSVFQDRERLKQLIYFVTESNPRAKEGANQIEIKQYDPILNNVIQLLTIRMDKILAFNQLLDGRFVIIDEEG